MKTYRHLVCLLIIIGSVATGSQPTENPDDQRDQKLFNGYRNVVMNAIAEHTETHLADLTKEYFVKAGKHPILIRVSKMDESGNWQVLLQSTDPEDRTVLPKINWAETKKVNIYDGENYILMQSGKIDKRNYEDGLYITLAITKSTR